MPTTVADRFWPRVRRSADPAGCWEWAGCHSGVGYGQLRVGGRSDGVAVGAHRIAYELVVGPIPDGLYIDHLCRNRGCVNPAHMEPVTHAENLRRGRGVRLTHQSVAAIRQEGPATHRELAKRYGVSRATIGSVLARKTWGD